MKRIEKIKIWLNRILKFNKIRQKEKDFNKRMRILKMERELLKRCK